MSPKLLCGNMALKLSICRNRGLCKCLCYAFLVIVVVEIVVFNTLVLVALMSVRKELSTVLDAPGNSLMDKLMNNNKFQEIVGVGRNGGFAKMMEETIGRIYIVSNPSSGNDKSSQPRLSFLGIDVSNAREATFLYRRIQSRTDFPYTRLIVDIGANDGLVSSNSFNFLQWGWSAILVEPQSHEINLAKLNNKRNHDPYNEGKQNLTLVQGILSDRDGMVDFVLSSSVDKMESHAMKSYQYEQTKNKHPFIVKVPSLTVRTFARRYNVPKTFGVLSLDAEGLGDKLLHQWMDLGFKPAYIIYEQLHNSEPIVTTVEYLEGKGYRYLNKLGWNYMFEHMPFPGDDN
ncbi:uncharacterized protein [Haliotis cracherodii]|uniref:uncharacterized protein n=1 Tax=Haliotis cracherodii TaxID=6455 RepID=UPI0039E7D3D5